jgi:hypothetical protein
MCLMCEAYLPVEDFKFSSVELHVWTEYHVAESIKILIVKHQYFINWDINIYTVIGSIYNKFHLLP